MNISTIKNLKLSILLFNFMHLKKLQRNKNLYSRYGIRKKVWSLVSHKDITLPDNRRPKLDEVQLSADVFDSKQNILNEDQIRQWRDDGVIILKNFFNTDLVESVKRELKDHLASHPGKIKFMNLHKISEAAGKMLHDQRLSNIIEFILGRKSFLFQTIYFTKGSQQNPHSDAYHMTTEPLGFLIAAWIPLEKTNEGNGPIVFYPGSHKLDYLFNDDVDLKQSPWTLDKDAYVKYEQKIESVISENNLQPRELILDKGDVCLWHSNLIHGGKAISDKSATRHSIIGHYLAKDILAYHEITQRPAILPN